ncbi:MAG: N-acetyltransferase family protein [Chitinophagales bacterium]
MTSIRFEELQKSHLPEVLEIYSYYVLNTTATFHTVVPSLDEMWAIFFAEHPIYGTFVIYDDDKICGYVILGQHKKREAYNRTAEVSVYLQPDYIGKGIGSKALQYIEEYARTKDLHVLVATICGENNKSINVFERNGFIKCAHYKETGKKFGKYLDVVAYQKLLK